MIGYLSAVEVSSGRPIDILRALQNRLNALPAYTNSYKVMGTNDQDLNSRINEKTQIVEFPRGANQNYRDAWAALMAYTPIRQYPPDAGNLVETFKNAVEATIEAYRADTAFEEAKTAANKAQADVGRTRVRVAMAAGGALLLYLLVS